jgi:hypothetical protein
VDGELICGLLAKESTFFMCVRMNQEYELEIRGLIKVPSRHMPGSVEENHENCLMENGVLRIPHCLDNWLTDSFKAVNPTHKPPSTSQKHYLSASGTHFC